MPESLRARPIQQIPGIQAMASMTKSPNPSRSKTIHHAPLPTEQEGGSEAAERFLVTFF